MAGQFSDISQGPRNIDRASFSTNAYNKIRNYNRFTKVATFPIEASRVGWKAAKWATSPIDNSKTFQNMRKYAFRTMTGRTGLAKYHGKAVNFVGRQLTSSIGLEFGIGMAMGLAAHQQGDRFLPLLAETYATNLATSAGVLGAARVMSLSFQGGGLAAGAGAGTIGTLGSLGSIVGIGAYIGASMLGINPVDSLFNTIADRTRHSMAESRGISKPMTQTATTMRATEAQLGLLGQSGQYRELGSEGFLMHN